VDREAFASDLAGDEIPGSSGGFGNGNTLFLRFFITTVMPRVQRDSKSPPPALETYSSASAASADRVSPLDRCLLQFVSCAGTHLFHSNFTPVIEQPPASVNGAFWRHCRPTASLLPVSALQSVAYADAARSNLPSVSVAAVRPPRSFTATDLAFGEDFAR
jgi:hypothetical protein